jgi:hypothetical protein
MDGLYFAGAYKLQTPGFFIFAQDGLDTLEFSLDAHRGISFPANIQQAFWENDIRTKVSLDPVDEELGAICRIRWIWSNDASTELYEIGLLREGPAADDDGNPLANRKVALLYAFSTSNDGDPSSGPDPQAKLISFMQISSGYL